MGPSLSVPELLIGMIEAYGAPRPSSFGLGELLEDLVNAIAEFGVGGGPSVKSVLSYGADPTAFVNPYTSSVTGKESTKAFNEALAALPTIQSADHGNVYTVPYGIIQCPGNYIINQETQLNPIGPFVMLDGLGYSRLYDFNTDAATGAAGILLTSPNNVPGHTNNNQFGQLYWSGGMRNIVLDGQMAGIGVTGVLAGGGEYFRMEHCGLANYADANHGGTALSSNGLVFSSYGGASTIGNNAGWMESFFVEVATSNCDNAVTYDGVGPGGTPAGNNSQGQGFMWVRLTSQPGQNGVTVTNGAWLYHSQLYVVGVMLEGTSPGGAQGVCLNVPYGTSAVDRPTLIQSSHIDVAVEVQQKPSDSGTTVPQTGFLEEGTAIQGCDGRLSFFNFANNNWGDWIPSTANNLNDFFSFWGWSEGDGHLTSGRNLSYLQGSAQGN